MFVGGREEPRFEGGITGHPAKLMLGRIDGPLGVLGSHEKHRPRSSQSNIRSKITNMATDFLPTR